MQDKLPPHIEQKLQQKRDAGTYRQLADKSHLLDFCSNDYLGLARSVFFHQKCRETFERVKSDYKIRNINGSSGARLITGHHQFTADLESQIAVYHGGEAALLFNSGYDANIGLISALPDRNDLILFDAYIHASIRDGIKMSKASSVEFPHNDIQAVEKILHSSASTHPAVYIVLESVYSMDGDTVDLAAFCALTDKYPNLYIILDEAHAGGVVGEKGEGLASKLQLQDKILGRIFTYGKAFGSHGAAVVCNEKIKAFLINYARSFIFTTAAHFYTHIGIKTAYDIMSVVQNRRLYISKLSVLFNQKLQDAKCVLSNHETTPVQGVILPGKDAVFQLSALLEQNGFYTKGIVFPTVPKGKERLRICFHYFNKESEVFELAELIQTFLSK